MNWLWSFLLAVVAIGSPAVAQQPEDQEVPLLAVWFTSYDCPESDETGLGSSSGLPIELNHFSEAHIASSTRGGSEGPGSAHARFHCKWVRMTGFMTWMNYYHYQGVLYEDFATTYFGGDRARYIIERFVEGAPTRSDLAQRRITVVGRFYNLCFAADEARRAAGDDFWWLFGPCHYGANNGMMLTDVRVEAIHDEAPLYLLGESNRDPLGYALRVESAPERNAMQTEVRAWLQALHLGIERYADTVISRNSYLSSAAEEEQAEVRAAIVSRDSYASYLIADGRFRRLNDRRVQIDLFWDGERRDRAYGCACLERSCEDRWPLFYDDAEEFLGAAACVALEREQGGGWQWN